MFKKYLTVFIVLFVSSIVFAGSSNPNQTQDQDQQQSQGQNQSQGQSQNSININYNDNTNTNRNNNVNNNNNNLIDKSVHSSTARASAYQNQILKLDNPVQPVQPVLPNLLSPALESPQGWNTSVSLKGIPSKTNYTIQEAGAIFNHWYVDGGWKGSLSGYKFDIVCWNKSKATSSIALYDSTSILNLIDYDQVATINLTTKDAGKVLGVFGDDTIDKSSERAKWAVAVLAMVRCGGDVVVYETTDNTVVRSRSEGLGTTPSLGGKDGSISLNAGGVIGSTEKEVRPGIKAVVLKKK